VSAVDGRLAGQVAIVTGAGQGVGRGVALAVAGEGARTVVLGRTLSKCQAVVEEIEARGGTAMAVQCDVATRGDVDAAVGRVVERWSQIDLLVNNAQSITYASIRRLTEEDMRTMWESGPMGCLHFMQACFPHLRQTSGCVVNMGSGAGIEPRPAMGGYAMTKEATRTLSRVAAAEWGRYGIRVTSICPLAMSPGFGEFAQSVTHGGAPDEMERSVTADVPLGRFGDPELDVGRAVVYLASADGRYVTGSTLMVDGGYNYLR
jgi:NAD(P)-dependent dehydrogenase (short-subunit alcohol dehydrogenase family)